VPLHPQQQMPYSLLPSSYVEAIRVTSFHAHSLIQVVELPGCTSISLNPQIVSSGTVWGRW
jgi:hypothetical protein